MNSIREEIRDHLKDHPWLISMIVHTALLLVMGLWVFPDWMEQRGQVITANFAEMSDEDSSFSLMPTSAIELPEMGEMPLEEQPVDTSAETALVTLATPEWINAAETLADSSVEELKQDNSTRLASIRKWMAKTGGEVTTERSESTTEQIGAADGIESATQAVENAIRGELSQGDTLVVWLLDASISLQLNRDRMAQRIRMFYDEIGALTRPESSKQVDRHRLFSSVVAFGRANREVSPPSLIGVSAIDAMTRVPVDTSGVENTMTAVEQVIEHYRYGRNRKERLMIVLLTDESGDDVAKLERTIDQCKKANAVVHVLGPTAVMGMQKGLQRWTAPGRGGEFFLTVDRGPESAVPQRIFLPYWHEAEVPLKNAKVQPVAALPWYGTAYRERVLSGFGPYALTRLALQTGGTFTLYDDGVDDRYDVDRLHEYLPSYQSVAAVQDAMRYSPLRQFVVQTAEWSMNEKELLAPPQMLFVGKRAALNPTQFTALYLTPSAFRSQSENLLRREKTRCEKAMQATEQWLDKSQTQDWQSLLDEEESPRWRAAYLLSRGRMLAVLARYYEYLAACERAPQTIQSDTNFMLFLPSARLHTSEGAALAERANEFLQRCAYEHRQTPWADLANWELDKGVGIDIQTRVMPRPAPRPAAPRMMTRPGGGSSGPTIPSL
ncbi:vWA domain-containing protein [Rhodopirellula halodulae]|uniref:vWA domain-containing protein n=1 Tax=Rhodopirellula halodulae TaxID=2894198 RepID=UPI001E42BCAA|nr:vWA domain-containing protein [Rhodopirellula sp. JC737]MCC9656565.1 VWA domain-containing protein [Rhodopirellula sp. JC737]